MFVVQMLLKTLSTILLNAPQVTPHLRNLFSVYLPMELEYSLYYENY